MTNSKRLLIIDDDHALADVYSAKLSEAFEVKVAHQGKEALELIQDWQPQIIVLDVMLGGDMNGFDVLRTIKQNPQTQNIPVLMLTNLDDQQSAALDLGATAYLTKVDTSMEQLLQTAQGHAR